jgi:hypothetical protein
MAKRVDITDLDTLFEDDGFDLDKFSSKLNGIFVDDKSDSDSEESGIEVECGDISEDGKASKVVPSGCPILSKAKEENVSAQDAAEKYEAVYCDECDSIACLEGDSICKHFGGVKECQVNCKFKGA